MDEALEMQRKGEAEQYEAFKNKFVAAKTTDDCYTPPAVYDAVAAWCADEYGVDPARVVRPFFPGGDYEHYEYPAGCVVLDNPPFSILSQIVRFYLDNKISFFLFAPALTALNVCLPGLTHICTGVSITYENGAEVNTSFLTNLDGRREVRSCPDLHKYVDNANKAIQATQKKTVPKYAYPDNVLTAAMVNYISGHGVEYDLLFGQSVFVRALDAQKTRKKSIFGGGLLLAEKAAAEKAAAEKAAAEKAAAEKAAAEKAAAEKWELSEREKDIIKSLDAQPKIQAD